MYSRENPSERYTTLLNIYKKLHVEGEKTMGLPPENTFPGQSLIPQAPDIKRIISATKSKNIFDYGSGKGQQYEPRPIVVKDENAKYNSIPEFWGIKDVTCYDPCYEPYNTLPKGKFDGVICTDVLEHCPEEDIDWVLDGLFSFAEKFVYANIASYPAQKILPNGENAHCTIKPLDWWVDKIDAVSKHYPNIVFEMWVEQKIVIDGKDQMERRRVANFNYQSQK